MPSIKEALQNTQKNLAETRKMLGKESPQPSSKPAKKTRPLPTDGKGILGTIKQLQKRKERLDDL